MYFPISKLTTYQNVGDAIKAVLRRRCIALNAYIRKKILKSTTQPHKTNLRDSRRKKIIRNRVEINIVANEKQ